MLYPPVADMLKHVESRYLLVNVVAQRARQISEEAENKVLEELKAEGCNIIEVTDVTPWQEATKSVIEENTKGLEDLYQQILDLQ